MRQHFTFRRRALTLAATLLLVGIPTTKAAAQSFRGQSFTAPAGASALLQQLTVGPTGLFASGSGTPFNANIFAFSGTALVGPTLFSQSLGTSFTGLSLAPNLALTPGGLYAVVVGVVGGTFTQGGVADFYAAGNAISCPTVTSCVVPFGGVSPDVPGFSVQFASTSTPVPEPASVVLMGIGLLAVGTVVVRQRRRGQPAR